MRVAVFTDTGLDEVSAVATSLGAVLEHAAGDVTPCLYPVAGGPGALRTRLRKDGAEAIHMATPGFAGLMARQLAAALCLPLLGTLHGLAPRLALGWHPTRGPLAPGNGLALLGPVRAILDEYRMPHRFIICGDGPLQGTLQRMLPDAVFTGAVATRPA
jgi:hypothetical protein